MLLFLRFICIIIFILLILGLFILKSEIRLNIVNYQYSNVDSDVLKQNKIKFEIYLFGKLKIWSFKIKNEKIQGNQLKETMEKAIEKIAKNNNKLLFFKKEKRKILKKAIIDKIIKNIKVKKFIIELYIGTESAPLTSYLVGILLAVIPNLIKNNIEIYDENKYSIKVNPVYNCKSKNKKENVFYINLNCIFSIKVVHIINMLIYKTKKERKELFYERTSYRRVNANCNGKY